ncbi:MAG TPA: patatin-like phospholipase family protein, partial [Baekduia sp.]|nr:patatin-like phospholipase family protein [Baekduia sp.]
MLIAPDTEGVVNVLALDGGGTRGLLNAILVSELEQALGAPAQRYFNVIAGTSTGALLAAGLAAPLEHDMYPGADVFVDVYRRSAENIFPKRRTLPRAILSAGARPKSSAALDDVLETYVRGVPLAETAVEVAIPAYDVEAREPVLFTRTAARAAG